MMWDVLILSMDLFDKLLEDLVVMERLLALPSGEFLELGMDQLLTGYFLGVGVPWWLVHRGNGSVISPGQGQSPDCSPQEEFSFGQARTLCRNSLPHKWRKNYWHSPP